MNDLPVACTLDKGDLQSRRAQLLPGLVRRAARREELPSGWRYTFAASTAMLSDLATVIDAERQCCRFLRFQLTVEPDGGPIVVEVTGPSGTREFLAELVETNR
jgi:hypothetical protein